MSQNQAVNSQDCIVLYENGLRRVKCFCGEICGKSIVRHIQRKHPEIWHAWSEDFLRRYNEGLSFKQIMRRYRDKNQRLLFTWTVVERNIKRLIEKQNATLTCDKQENPESWYPKNFRFETSTLWDFPKRDNWAVHRSTYRGNWPPEIPRNLILR